MKYKVWLTVDNNRYGAYYKCYAKKTYVVDAKDKYEAYDKAVIEIRKIDRYKNALQESFDNIGNHDYCSFSINVEAVLKVEEK
jgi:hypothetical protein